MWEICSYGNLLIYNVFVIVIMFILVLQDNHLFKTLTLNLIGQILSGT